MLSFVRSRSSAKNVYNVHISGLLERPIPVWRVQHIFVWCSLSSVNGRRMHTIVEEAHLSRTQFLTHNVSETTVTKVSEDYVGEAGDRLVPIMQMKRHMLPLYLAEALHH